MARTRDENTGQYRKKWTDRMVLDAVEDAGELATTQDVADSLGSPYRSALHRLKELRDDGTVMSTRVGNSFVWSIDK